MFYFLSLVLHQHKSMILELKTQDHTAFSIATQDWKVSSSCTVKEIDWPLLGETVNVNF